MNKTPKLSREEKIREIVRLAHGYQLTSLDNIKCIVVTVSDDKIIDWEREQFAHLDNKRINKIYNVVKKFGNPDEPEEPDTESSGDSQTEGVAWSDRPLPSIFNPLKN